MNNKKIPRTTMIVFALLVLMLSVNAQDILTENSKETITNISIMIDRGGLSLPESAAYNYTEENITYVVSDTVNNSIYYVCSLQNLSQFNGTLDEEIKYHQVAANITYGVHALSLACEYNITTLHEILNITTNLSDNTTQAQNYSYSENNVQNIMTEKIIIVDSLPPVINISLTNQTLDVLVNDITDTECIFADNENILPFNISLTYVFNRSSNYSVNCTDIMDNNQYHNYSIYINTTGNNTENETNSTNITIVPFLNISINKQNLNLGELGYLTINANNYSNVSITICPQADGWVQCYMTPMFVNDVFPKVQVMPYSNKTGAYLVEAMMDYDNITLTTNLSFNVINTISARISSTKKVVVEGEIITFNATATGGIGNYNYVWTLHDGQKFYGKGAYKNYTAAGEFTEYLFVNDSQGNNYTTSIDIDVRPKYTLTVITSDQKTGSRMKDVLVEVGGYNRTTNSAGQASFILMESDYDIYASKEGYGSVIEDISLDEDLTVYLNMTFDDFTPPEIELLTNDDATFSKTDVKLKFQADDITDLRCELYLAEGNDSWFTLKDYGDNLLVNTIYTFELTDLESGDYEWRVDCIDDNGNRATSPEYSFIVSDEKVAMSIEQNDEANSDINKALDKINAYAGAEADVVETLNLKQTLKELLEKSNNLERDIHNLAYRRDLDEQGKSEMQERLVNDIKLLQDSIPSDIQVTDSRTFIKYVRDQELQDLLKEYATIKNLNINTKGFFEATKKTQNKVVISTKAINAILTYPDGKTKEITLIKKEISVSNPSYEPEIKGSGISFVEVIPKSVAADVKKVNIVNKEYDVLKADPIIEFPSSTTMISYYINETIDLSSLEQLDTIIIDKNVNALTSTTGFSILGADSIKDVDGKTAMIGVIAILILIYVLSSFDVWSKIKGLLTNSKKKISYIRVLVNDALDYLVTKDYERAALIYREIRLNYESSSDSVRNAVYQECYELCNALDAYYFTELTNLFNQQINDGLKNMALDTYQKMEHTFEKFEEQFRKDREKILQDSFNKLNQMSKK